MYFVALVKFRKKVTRESVVESLRKQAMEAKEGIRYRGIYWTLGRYDVVAVFEAENEAAAMNMSLRRGDDFDMETLVALPADEARKLVG
jgi:uncharacterized protein with GYD domain